MAKGVLFDFNGTLLFDSHLHIKAFQLFAERHGLPFPTAEYVANELFGRCNKDLFPHFVGRELTDEEVSAFADEKEGCYRSLCLEDPSCLTFAPRALEMIEYMNANGIPFAVGTGSGIDNVSFYMEHMNLGKWVPIEHITYANGTFPGKPAPDVFLHAASSIGLDASECIVFEDGHQGLLAAINAKAEGVYAVVEKSIPDPDFSDLNIQGKAHDYYNWREIFRKHGLLR